jgi:hypothetical protein
MEESKWTEEEDSKNMGLDVVGSKVLSPEVDDVGRDGASTSAFLGCLPRECSPSSHAPSHALSMQPSVPLILARSTSSLVFAPHFFKPAPPSAPPPPLA